jgi:ribosomal protein S18 acetylase RimI-like enzyme
VTVFFASSAGGVYAASDATLPFDEDSSVCALAPYGCEKLVQEQLFTQLTGGAANLLDVELDQPEAVTRDADRLLGKAGRLLTENDRVTGIAMEDGDAYECAALVVTTGTFLNGLIHVGPEQRPAGRHGEPPSRELSDSIRSFGFEMGRLKTGTPPRLHRSSIDFAARVLHQQKEGYQLAFLELDGVVRSVAGFRIFNLLFSGRTLYIDDLVTHDSDRSRGFGVALFDWLIEYAKEQACEHQKG